MRVCVYEFAGYGYGYVGAVFVYVRRKAKVEYFGNAKQKLKAVKVVSKAS